MEEILQARREPVPVRHAEAQVGCEVFGHDLFGIEPLQVCREMDPDLRRLCEVSHPDLANRQIAGVDRDGLLDRIGELFLLALEGPLVEQLSLFHAAGDLDG